jgi:hypothetical protein
MGKKIRDKNFKKVVQGEWTLGHSIQELRENVFVGDRALKDLSEEELAVIWKEKIGTSHFRQAVRMEVVHRVSDYFRQGFEREKQILTKNPIAEALNSTYDNSKVQDQVEEYMKKWTQ